jgi:hypothetical protein
MVPVAFAAVAMVLAWVGIAPSAHLMFYDTDLASGRPLRVANDLDVVLRFWAHQ